MTQLSNESTKRLVGRRIINAAGPCLILDDGRKICLDESEIEYLNDMFEPDDNAEAFTDLSSGSERSIFSAMQGGAAE